MTIEKLRKHVYLKLSDLKTIKSMSNATSHRRLDAFKTIKWWENDACFPQQARSLLSYVKKRGLRGENVSVIWIQGLNCKKHLIFFKGKAGKKPACCSRQVFPLNDMYKKLLKKPFIQVQKAFTIAFPSLIVGVK